MNGTVVPQATTSPCCTRRRPRLFPRAATFLAEPHLVRKRRTRLCVRWRDHRIIVWQTPLRAVLVGREVVSRTEVALQRLELPPVLKADDVVVADRLLDRNSRCLLFGLDDRSCTRRNPL